MASRIALVILMMAVACYGYPHGHGPGFSTGNSNLYPSGNTAQYPGGYQPGYGPGNGSGVSSFGAHGAVGQGGIYGGVGPVHGGFGPGGADAGFNHVDPGFAPGYGLFNPKGPEGSAFNPQPGGYQIHGY